MPATTFRPSPRPTPWHVSLAFAALMALCLVGLLLGTQAQAFRADTPALRYVEDTTDRLSVDAVLQRPDLNWQRAGTSDPALGYSSSSWWFDLSLPAGGDDDDGTDRVLEIAYPVLDRVEISVLDAANRTIAFHVLGDKQPFAARPLPLRHFVVPLAAGPDGARAARV